MVEVRANEGEFSIRSWSGSMNSSTVVLPLKKATGKPPLSCQAKLPPPMFNLATVPPNGASAAGNLKELRLPPMTLSY